MKKKPTTKLFCISCENQKGILSRIITTCCRPGYEIVTMSQSSTDISDIVLITMEVAIPAAMIDHMINRINRIIGVLDTTISFGSVLNSAVYRVLSNQADPVIWDILNRHNARCILMQENGHLLISQIANASAIQSLFNELDGPSLVGFSRQALPISQPFCWDNNLLGAHQSCSQLYDI